MSRGLKTIERAYKHWNHLLHRENSHLFFCGDWNQLCELLETFVLLYPIISLLDLGQQVLCTTHTNWRLDGLLMLLCKTDTVAQARV
jgi:hypothetical protein